MTMFAKPESLLQAVFLCTDEIESARQATFVRIFGYKATEGLTYGPGLIPLLDEIDRLRSERDKYEVDLIRANQKLTWLPRALDQYTTATPDVCPPPAAVTRGDPYQNGYAAGWNELLEKIRQTASQVK